MLALGGVELFLHQTDDELVRDQMAPVHIGFGLLPQGGALGDGLAQEVARGDHGNPERGFDIFCLGSFAGAGSA